MERIGDSEDEKVAPFPAMTTNGIKAPGTLNIQVCGMIPVRLWIQGKSGVNASAKAIM
jgi:hypothetical protein